MPPLPVASPGGPRLEPSAGYGLMLRIAKLTDAEYVLQDVAGGLEDYYLGLGEAPGVWFGGLARELAPRGWWKRSGCGR